MKKNRGNSLTAGLIAHYIGVYRRPENQMNASHTPGPWSFNAQGNTLCQEGAPISGFVCGLNDVAPANIRLIKAAPELLGLACWVVENEGECIGDHPKMLAAFRAVVEKAIG
jgi:hypothetical protein